MKKLLLFSFLFCASVHAQSINVVTSSIVESTTTASNGTSFVQLAKDNAIQVRLFNNTGTTIDVQFYGSGKAFPMPTATQMILRGISNSNQLYIKRDDNGTTPVTIFYIIER